MDEETSLFDRPVVRAFLMLFLLLAGYTVLTLLVADQAKNYNGLILDTFLCLGGMAIWTVFFSQFILPVRKLRDRISIFERMMAYFAGFHGPAIFIENGNIRARQEEREKKGPGVLWLDHASAAILRTATKFTKTVGPGVHFTSKDEYIAASVDLHRMTQTIGPAGTENPFTVPETDENYQRIKDSGLQTRALTRDSIEVMAEIAITFRISAQENEGETIYGYNADNVAKVITDSMVQGAKTDQPIWSPMPAKMAADIWRGYIARFRLNQLFEIPPGETRTNLQMISGLVSARLNKDIVQDLDEFGNITGRTISSTECQKLKSMGIEVLGVNIKRIILPPDIEEQLTQKWTTMWAKNAKKEGEQVEQRRRIQEERGQVEAQKEYADMLTSEYQATLPRNKRHAVYLFTHGISQSVIRNPGLMNKLSKSETNDLTEIARWLKEDQ